MSDRIYCLQAKRVSSLARITPKDASVTGSSRLSMADGRTPDEHLDTSVGCFWNDRSLVVLFQARFRTLRTIPTPPGSPVNGKTLSLWENSDVLEVFIGRDARILRAYSEFQVAPDGRWLDTRVRLDGGNISLDTNWDSGLRASSTVDTALHLWRATLEIPWSAAGGGPPGAREWDVNFYRASGRFHGDELLAWAPTGYGEGCFHRPQLFGMLELA